MASCLDAIGLWGVVRRLKSRRPARVGATQAACPLDDPWTVVASCNGTLRGADELPLQVAVRVEVAAAADLIEANVEIVRRVLRARGLTCFSVPVERPLRPRLGVTATRAEVVEALRDAPEGCCVQLGEGATPAQWFVARDEVTSADWPQLEAAPVWSVYQPVTDPHEQVVLGRHYACEVEFWTETDGEDGPGPSTYLPPSWNCWAKSVQEPGLSAVVDGRRQAGVGVLPSPANPNGTPYFSHLDFPVDLVYTWVDGSDPKWQARKSEALGTGDVPDASPDANAASRFGDHQELRFSLRSVAMYATFVRHIYIVTDGQVPEWLEVDDPTITVVDHREIFSDDRWLPTFNSHAIEAQLHHIDGLAEHFIYLNDDFFFCRPVAPWQFFHANGISRFFLSKALIGGRLATGEDVSVDQAALNSQQLIQQHFGKMVTRKIRHAPYALRRSVLAEMEQTFPDHFERTLRNRIRGKDDLPVVSSLYQYYAYLTGRALPAGLRTGYVALGAPRFEERLLAAAASGQYDTVCVNDAGGPVGASSPERLFDRVWPFQSSFERSDRLELPAASGGRSIGT